MKRVKSASGSAAGARLLITLRCFKFREGQAAANRRFHFNKRRLFFISMHNERLSIVAMCVRIQIGRASESTESNSVGTV
jgi:hypothetical protein